MKHICAVLFSVFAILSLNSCGDNAKDELMKDQLKHTNDLAEIMEGVNDGSITSNEAVERLGSMKDASEGFKKRNKEVLEVLPQKELDEVMTKYGEEASEAFSRVSNAMQKLQLSGKLTPEISKALNNLK